MLFVSVERLFVVGEKKECEWVKSFSFCDNEFEMLRLLLI